MSFKASVQYFQTLVTSFHPVIVIDTVEEERVQGLISAACSDMQMAVFEWSVAQGLMRSPDSPNNRWQNEYAPPGAKRGQALPKTTEPLDMLRHIQEMSFKAVFWLKDFAEHLKDPVVARQFREVSQQFSFHSSTLVLSGSGHALPPTIAQNAVYLDIKLPEPDERHAILHIHLGRRQQGTENFDLNELVIATEGFSGAEIEQAIITAHYRALYENRPANTALLLEEIKRTVPLSVTRREDIQRLRTTARERFVAAR